MFGQTVLKRISSIPSLILIYFSLAYNPLIFFIKHVYLLKLELKDFNRKCKPYYLHPSLFHLKIH